MGEGVFAQIFKLSRAYASSLYTLILMQSTIMMTAEERTAASLNVL